MGKKIIVVGGGPGGYVAAIRSAQLGAEVTLVEKQYLGGTCLNVGCIPTKCLLHSAEIFDEVKRRGSSLGIVADNLQIDFSKVMANRFSVSKKLTGGIRALLKGNGVTCIDGEASFIAPKKLSITHPDGTQEIMVADKIILATGSVNSVPPISGLKDNPNCIDSTGALALEAMPHSMVVIGGGVIGLELACAYAAFGTDVTVVEALDHVLPMLDSDLIAIGQKRMKKLGIKLHTECPVQSVEESNAGVKVICRNKNGEEICFEAEKVLVAVGRRANTASLGLEIGNINNNHGRIIVNDKMETSEPDVYAIGDCVMGYAQLAHTASVMGEVAAENAMGIDAHYDQKTSPTCVYIMPEAASVGLTEDECKARGIDYLCGKFPMAGNGKALILNGGEGLVKILSDKSTHRVLGMHIVGPRATDLIAEGALAIQTGATIDDIIATIHSHPTVTEAMREAALNAEKRSIHILN